jgi:outer membrane lipoprotein-sorting protein
MRLRSLAGLLAFGLGFALAVSAQQLSQQAPQRDPQAVSIVQLAAAAMGGVAPSDSTATGTITVVAGSLTESGTITILTRGTNQTAEQISLPSGLRAVIYSNGEAEETTPSVSAAAVTELAVTDKCPAFPLPLLLSALINPDEVFQYIGQETLSGAAVQHVRVWNTFASNPHLQKVASFSAQDIWFDASSGLPLKLAYTRQAGSGAVSAIPVEVFFSNYTNVNGVLYPFQIQKSYNGTPSQTITIQRVTFNTGLTDAQFQVQ